MDRTRVPIIVEVDLDPVLGEFHTKESAEHNIQRILQASIPHYNPKIVTGMPTMPPEAVAALQRALAGGPMGLLASLTEMLADPETVESMKQVTEAMSAQLPQEGDEQAPDYYPGEEST